MRDFRIRCSAIGTLMSGSIYPTLTKELQGIYAKEKAGKALTENQQKKKDAYEHGLQNPELPQGVKTYLKTWWKERKYGYVHEGKKVLRRKEFTSKYTDKGNKKEEDSIDFIAEALGYGYLEKYEGPRLRNEYIEGECDVLLPNVVIDNKCSWDCFTFPLFDDEPNTDYWWQGQGYMILTGRREYVLVYTLMDMPEDMLIKECYIQAKIRGMEEVDADLYLEVKAKHTYSNLPNDLRVKAYYFPYEESAEQQIIERVKLARKYLQSLEVNNLIHMDKKGSINRKERLDTPLDARAA